MMRTLSGGGDCGGVPDAEVAAPIIPRSISAEPQALPERRASGSLPGTAAGARMCWHPPVGVIYFRLSFTACNDPHTGCQYDAMVLSPGFHLAIPNSSE